MEIDNRRKQLTHFYRRHYLSPLVESYGMGFLASETKALQIETANKNCDFSFQKNSRRECPICCEPLIGHISKLKCNCHFTCHSHCWLIFNSGKSKEFKCPQCRKDMASCEDMPPLKKYLDFDFEKSIPQLIPEKDFIEGMEKMKEDEEWDEASKKIKDDEALQKPFTSVLIKVKMGLRVARNQDLNEDF